MRAAAAALALVLAGCYHGVASNQPECIVRDVRVETVSCRGHRYMAVSVERCCGQTCITGGVGDIWEIAP